MISRNCVDRRACAGYTMGEVISLVVVGSLLMLVFVGVIVPGLFPPRRGYSRQLKDSTQIRGITQAMIIWAGSNNGQCPLPGQFDVDGATTTGDAESKNTTGNILSVLMFNSAISPEICVSPGEVNAQVQTMADYEYTKPQAAATPDKALWDPRFRGTPMDGGKPGMANQSYAHVVPVGRRRAELWKDTYSATQPIFGNRGPTYVASDSGALIGPRWKLLSGPLGDKSNTLQIHGGRSTWEGNIAYNDGHVTFETSPTPSGIAYLAGAGKGTPTPDNLFVNESDEDGGDADGAVMKGSNAYLRPIAEVKDARRPVIWRD